MTVLYTRGRPRRPTSRRSSAARRIDLDELLATSDIVSLHCPLVPETRGLIDAAALARMKPTAVLVNTSRGPVIDQAALAVALRTGAICRRRPRRHRPGADRARRPAGLARQLPGRAAHRVGVARDARPDGRDGGRATSSPASAANRCRTRCSRPASERASAGTLSGGPVAQWSEQGTFNPWVEGSNPSRLARTPISRCAGPGTR